MLTLKRVPLQGCEHLLLSKKAEQQMEPNFSHHTVTSVNLQDKKRVLQPLEILLHT